MGFESADFGAGSVARTDINEKSGILPLSAEENRQLNLGKQASNGIEAMFGTPVIDSSLQTAAPETEVMSILDSFFSQTGNADICDKFPALKTKEDALDSTAKGDSILHRMFEVAVKTPAGITEASAFENVFGSAAAQKMNELGILKVSRQSNRFEIALKNPLHFEGRSGSIDVDRRLSFIASDSGGRADIDRISGVRARSGIFQFPIDGLDLQARKEGYLSGLITANFSQTRVCAAPDGQIYR